MDTENVKTKEVKSNGTIKIIILLLLCFILFELWYRGFFQNSINVTVLQPDNMNATSKKLDCKPINIHQILEDELVCMTKKFIIMFHLETATFDKIYIMKNKIKQKEFPTFKSNTTIDRIIADIANFDNKSSVYQRKYINKNLMCTIVTSIQTRNAVQLTEILKIISNKLKEIKTFETIDILKSNEQKKVYKLLQIMNQRYSANTLQILIEYLFSQEIVSPRLFCKIKKDYCLPNTVRFILD